MIRTLTAASKATVGKTLPRPARPPLMRAENLDVVRSHRFRQCLTAIILTLDNFVNMLLAH